MKRKIKMRLIVRKQHWDEKPDNICYCGYPLDGRPHNGPRCQPPVLSIVEIPHININGSGEPLNM